MFDGNISVGYAREGAVGPSLSCQIASLEAAGAVRIYHDQASGATEIREQWRVCLDELNHGDTLLVSDLSRLGRSAADLADIVALLARKGIRFRVLAEPWLDTGGSCSQMILDIFECIGRYERNRLSERTRAGLTAARARGRLGGRPPAMTKLKLEAARDLRNKKATLSEIASTLGVSISTVARALSGGRN
ncbi:recombinase family protein [Paenarthrobacter sp. NPDC089675]|uniref:recombinase family protein n=1 Tax=Paenarthrobacter sp. NPDC089675 TaxID=3364376 RepID=UPI003802C3D0